MNCITKVLGQHLQNKAEAARFLDARHRDCQSVASESCC